LGGFYPGLRVACPGLSNIGLSGLKIKKFKVKRAKLQLKIGAGEQGELRAIVQSTRGGIVAD
jgi:hypothetical protein